MLKKLLGVVISLSLCLVFAACTEKESSSKADSSSKTDSSSVVDSSSVADSSQPDSSQTDSSEPDSSEPESSVPDSSDSESSGGSFGPPVKEEAKITPPMWKVESESGAVIYFLGSMHALAQDSYPLPDEIIDAFNNSDSLAVECDIVAYASDMDKQMESIMNFMYIDGTTIKDHIDAELYDSAKAILEDAGLYNEAYEVYNTIMWSSLIDMAMMEDAGLNSDLGIDNQLLKKAHGEGKDIIEIETIEMQEAILYGQPEEFNLYMLEGSVYYYEDQVAVLKDMYEAWKIGDLDAIMATDEESEEIPEEEEISDELLAMIEDYNYKLMDERNVGMIDKAVEMLENGDKVFYVVGAAHYYGDTGILKGLEDAGYTVEPVVFD
ncbi:MAG: TraB/GumN family protein [Oscillospiraceae bacterium]|nr:TraB/GumN family protein [Oscillospiraceae bacterium]